MNNLTVSLTVVLLCLSLKTSAYSTHTSKYINSGQITVEKSKTLDKVSSSFQDTFEANRHYNEMSERTACREPRPVVVNVQEFYRNSSIEYLPHCSILHRCDHESGCCKNNRVCRAKTKSFVQLTFFSVPMDKSKSGTEVVKLTFTNHTSCQCEENLEDVETQGPTTTTSTLPPWLFDKSEEQDYEEEHNCKRCPRPFAVRIIGDDICSCDCFHGDKDCIEIKKGLKPMAPEFSNCVRRGDCETPTCYTNEFDVDRGRCQRVCRSGSQYNSLDGRCVKIRHKKRHQNHNL